MPRYNFLLGYLFVLILFFCLSSCINENADLKISKQDSSESSVHTLIHDSFKIGIGLHGFNLIDSSAKQLPKFFNSLSTANAMKFEAIHPHADEYHWHEADSLVSFAQKHSMVVRGHTLLWSNRNPYWLFWDEKGDLVHRSLLDQRLKDHIQTVVSRYKGKVYAWDVVNEAIYDNDKEFLKTNNWYKIMGADYIKKAFQYAHEADTTAALFYNDYDAERPDKLKRITKLIKWLQSEKVPIHGIGIQAHWKLDSPSLTDIENAINTYAALGLQVQITELDVVITPNFKGSEEEKMNLLTSRYAEIFEVFHKNRNKLSGITFWQTEDIPAKYPPLFDADLNPTKIYQAVLNAWSAN